MEYGTLIQRRRSCRNFAMRAIPPSLLAQLLAEAECAPMAGNRRGDRKLIAVSEPETLRKMGRLVRERWTATVDEAGGAFQTELRNYGENFYHFAEAPTVIFLAGRREPDFFRALLGEAQAELFHGNVASVLQSGMLLQLSAENAGLGSCMLTGPLFAEKELKIELKLNNRWRLYGLVSIGYRI